MPSKLHTHKFRRYIRGKWNETRYACADPDCYKVARPSLLLGKPSVCWKCEQDFILTRDNLETAKPRCLNCADTKEAREYRRMEEMALEMTQSLGLEEQKEPRLEGPLI